MIIKYINLARMEWVSKYYVQQLIYLYNILYLNQLLFIVNVLNMYIISFCDLITFIIL